MKTLLSVVLLILMAGPAVAGIRPASEQELKSETAATWELQSLGDAAEAPGITGYLLREPLGDLGVVAQEGKTSKKTARKARKGKRLKYKKVRRKSVKPGEKVRTKTHKVNEGKETWKSLLIWGGVLCGFALVLTILGLFLLSGIVLLVAYLAWGAGSIMLLIGLILAIVAAAS